MISLENKWVLITGASRGIGKLSAEMLAQYGCNFILHSRKKEHCNEILEKVRSYGVQAYSVEAELSSPEQVEAMLEEIDKIGTPLDVILNNAGLQNSEDDIDNNLKGTINVTEKYAFQKSIKSDQNPISFFHPGRKKASTVSRHRLASSRL